MDLGIGKSSAPLRLRFDEERALRVFSICAEWWRERRGFYAGLTAPQARFTPAAVRKDPIVFGNWLLTVSIPMRGGINSEDAFRAMSELYRRSPHLFNLRTVAGLSAEDLNAAIAASAREIHNNGNGSFGKRGAGTLSYKLPEHLEAWIQNAQSIVEHWGGDIRNIFRGSGDFEEIFRRIDNGRKNPARLVGMRRKIFSLLALWLQEFRLIPEFPLPIIVDFHVLRTIFQHEILVPRWRLFGPGKPKTPERQRSIELQKYPSVKITPKLVSGVINWSLGFIERHGLTSYDVSHGLWFLSRELCSGYYGNRSETRKVDGARGRITERLIEPAALLTIYGWPKRYQDPCVQCPVEETCAISVGAGPHYDWGTMLNAGPHVPFPGRMPLLPGIGWRELPSSFKSSKRRKY